MSDEPKSTPDADAVFGPVQYHYPMSALDELLSKGFAAPGGVSEAEIKQRAEDLAMAVAYTWLTKDSAAQEAFLTEIVELGEGGAGVLFAVEALTTARLFGVRPGMVRPGTTISTHWKPGPDADAEDLARYQSAVEIITDLWSGLATWDHGRTAKARGRLFEVPLQQVRDILWIMAFDVAAAMEQFAVWQAAGADLLETYRQDNPPPNAVAPPAPAS